ncbi:MAG TPA: hypothetical protein PKV74_10330, partial [Syntrophales bacterium]|nr:hypothetical protein [Syntrophales bacterium]
MAQKTMTKNKPAGPPGAGKVILIVAVTLFLAALAVNEWTLALWSCPDGGFARDDRLRIAGFQAFCLLSGTALLLNRNKPLTLNILLLAGTL